MIERQIAEAQRQAELARNLLADSLLQDAFARLEAAYLSGMRNSAPEHSDEREVAYYRLQALDQLKQDLEAIVKGGKVAEFNNRKKRLNTNTF